MNNTPMHCPGFEANKSLTSVTFKCPSCSKTVEVFSDEFDRPHKCPGCKQQIDFTKVTFEGSSA